MRRVVCWLFGHQLRTWEEVRADVAHAWCCRRCGLDMVDAALGPKR